AWPDPTLDPGRGQPLDSVPDVGANVVQRAGRAADLEAGPLRHEARRTPPDIPVVVREVMEARLGDRPARMLAVAVEGDDQIEASPGGLARAPGDRPRARLALRLADGALVRVGRNRRDPAARRSVI